MQAFSTSVLLSACQTSWRGELHTIASAEVHQPFTCGFFAPISAKSRLGLRGQLVASPFARLNHVTTSWCEQPGKRPMATEVMEKPLQYLDKAVTAIRDLGLWPEQTGRAADHRPSQRDHRARREQGHPDRPHADPGVSAFNEVVREQVAAMNVGERYEDITNNFNSIRDDAKGMVDQLDDGKLDMMERASQRLDEGVAAAISRRASTRSATAISRSPRTPRTRSTASTRSSRPIAISAAR